MAAPVITANHRIYEAHQRDTLLSEVVAVVGVLLPRALAVAGIGKEGQVLVIRYSDYAGQFPEWDARFFEQQLLNEPLLALAQQAKAVFAGSEYELLVPEALFDQQAVGQWMKTLFPLSPVDHIIGCKADADQLHCLTALPQEIHKLAGHYMPAAQFLPVSSYQFYKPAAGQGALLQCLIGAQDVIATLRRDGQVIWHQAFTYQAVTDIVWQFAAVCKEQAIEINDLEVIATTLCDTCHDHLVELEAFFPHLRWAAGQRSEEGAWAPAIFLMQQLHACVS